LLVHFRQLPEVTHLLTLHRHLAKPSVRVEQSLVSPTDEWWVTYSGLYSPNAIQGDGCTSPSKWLSYNLNDYSATLP
jgi:hypothetical protein